MIPVSTHYDEYIDRPKFSEQKKRIWVYSSSPTPQEGSEQPERSLWSAEFSNPCFMETIPQTSMVE